MAAAARLRRAALTGVIAPLLAALLATAFAGCGARIALPAASAVTLFDRTLIVNGAPLTLHLARPTSAASRSLLIYSTGDGGWRGKDRDLFRMLVTTGRRVAGISAPEYVKHLRGESGTTTPARLGRDYAAVIALARSQLGSDAADPVILVGVSRGAGLTVVAAGQPQVQRQLAGVLAIALTREEEYVRWFARLLPHAGGFASPNPPYGKRAGRSRVMLQVADYLPRLARLPVSLIQSTGDNYLPAAEARQLFAAGAPARRFVEIESRNHSFSDRRAEMYTAARDSLDWIEATAEP